MALDEGMGKMLLNSENGWTEVGKCRESRFCAAAAFSQRAEFRPYRGAPENRKEREWLTVALSLRHMKIFQ